MASKNNPGSYDCYKAAEQDEPMFVLLARDPLAPALVRMWIELRRMTKVRTAEEVDKRIEAAGCALDMEDWHIKNRLDKKFEPRK